ncbi:MAG: valine--tRNA ligase [Saprospiraceae bacterium]|nr:valine--tRNA ligase [Saprospiraceae bacterium]
MELDARFQPGPIESKWYSWWEQNNYFSSKPDGREPFSIVIPPPNVTGVLHMGHMLNNTIQDVLIRRARLQGKNACWVPGTDHASIATEAKVVQMLRERGIKKSDITRDEFLSYAWEWKDKYGSIILEQLKKLGSSCDWDRTAFTMDDIRSKAVINAFVDLYNKGKLYRGKRMVNWDPEAKTVLSNEEVIHNQEQANLFHILYKLEGSETEGIIIATQRPETIMVDSAVCVHPDDSRYTHLHGKRVIIPLINKSIPIITDSYIDIEFGTGALKVTPAHDQNDYEIGKKHGLEIIDCLNEDGTLNENAQILIGEDRFVARKKIKPLLEEAGVLIKIEPYMTSIGRSERTNAVVEPRLSLQWYVKMDSLAEPALKAVMNEEIQFIPEHFKNTYRHWLENIRDWCISRQLWWGHRVPAWYYGEQVFVAKTADEALQIAIRETGNQQLCLNDLKQDEDVLDTWFSSWLWPISVFDGDEDTEDFKYYFPTAVLVTGWDIIFLWVARMIMASYEWKGTLPFYKVYFTGMVRDKQRRKMSKSLGNSPDALKLIEDFGADGVRFGMLACSPAGGDLLFDDKLCEQGRNFSNKMWNALRLIKGWKQDATKTSTQGEKLLMQWIDEKLNETLEEVDKLFEQFKLSEALKTIYSFVWEDFCAFYLEVAKPPLNEEIPSDLYEKTLDIYEKICLTLHPFMPFITEEIWHGLKLRVNGDDCMQGSYPKFERGKKEILESVQELRTVITQVRELRNKHGVKMNIAVPLYIMKNEQASLLTVDGAVDILRKLAVLSEIQESEQEVKGTQSFLGMRHKYFLELPVTLDIEAEKIELLKEIQYNEGFINSVIKKLENERFVSSAPADLVERERQKLEDGQSRLKALRERLAGL